ncbi:membrane steroid-binding protein 2 [Scaptodrosophila lebanonensis]|uniref:Membrane steroid-binding protein 2 n=1 Tax=Drosophila lebanonensis TaxID=7225 RepID=A0A6J2TZF9_DROLE|nr:membrane steroid-binding protein 2 [Scaptodrosophila lebanonensis]
MCYEVAGEISIVTLVLATIVAILGYVGAFYQLQQTHKRDAQPHKAPDLPPLPTIRLTSTQLMGFDGRRSDGRILVALKGKIYDVSSDISEFGLGGTLNHVAGRDFTLYLIRIMELHGKQVDYIVRWEQILGTNYAMVGYLVDEEGNPKESNCAVHNKHEEHEDMAINRIDKTTETPQKSVVEDV